MTQTPHERAVEAALAKHTLAVDISYADAPYLRKYTGSG